MVHAGRLRHGPRGDDEHRVQEDVCAVKMSLTTTSTRGYVHN
jgi:hypothetical protein